MKEHMVLLAMQLGVILFAAFAGGRVAKRLGIPPVLGELGAGMLIGPYLLGGVHLPGLEHSLFPIENPEFPISPELYGITTIASILLLFLVGLETNLKLLFRFMLAGTIVGFGGAFGSFLLGDLCGVLLFRYYGDTSIGFMSTGPLFLGIISAATSVGITARILTENKRIDSPEGVTILAGAVIDDVLGVLLLALTLGIAKSGSVQWGEISRVTLISCSMLFGVATVGLLITHKVSRFFERIPDSITVATLSFGAALIAASFFERAGLAMIVGAYVMGLIISPTPHRHDVNNSLIPLYRVFVPVFFCVMGMLVDFKTFADPKVLTIGILYTIAAVIAKLAGCGLPTIALGYSITGALRVGIGMIPRGEVALIIMGIGLAGGYIDQDMFAAAMFMTVGTTLIAPYLLQVVLRIGRPTLRKGDKPVDTEGQSLFLPLPTPAAARIVNQQVVETLKAEGFTSHAIDLDNAMYHVHNHNTSFMMQAGEDGLRFDCNESDFPIINAIVFDALADLERAFRDMHEHALQDDVRKRILASQPEPRSASEILGTSISLNPRAFDVNLRGATKRFILTELLDILVKAGELDPAKKDQALEDLLVREESMSTGVPFGVALPHARTKAVGRLVCAVGLHRDGADFSSVDGSPTHIFILVLSPEESPGEYLQFVASLGSILGDPHKREKMLSARTNEELYQAFIAN